MDDILGLGKMLPIDKLIDVLSKVTGRLSKSYFDKKDVETKAFEIKRLAEAKAEEMKIISTAIKENYLLVGGIEYKDKNVSITSMQELTQQKAPYNIDSLSLEERTKSRLEFKETQKQLNIESITAFAAEDLKNEQTVSDDPLDEDWTTRFFSIAEEISNEEMQALWGRILSGEIKQPKSYSLRTLELLKNLSKEEADVFTKFANVKLVSGNNNFILNNDNGQFLESKFGITFSDRLLLTELGLISSENNLSLSFPANKTEATSIINYGKKSIVLDKKEDTPEQEIQVLLFTKTGTELSRLIEQSFDLDYLERVCACFVNPKVKIEYGDILKTPDGELILKNKVKYDK